jgi:hypothetical protein
MFNFWTGYIFEPVQKLSIFLKCSKIANIYGIMWRFALHDVIKNKESQMFYVQLHVSHA